MYVKTEVRRRDDAKREKWSSSCVTNRSDTPSIRIWRRPSPPISALGSRVASRALRSARPAAPLALSVAHARPRRVEHALGEGRTTRSGPRAPSTAPRAAASKGGGGGGGDGRRSTARWPPARVAVAPASRAAAGVAARAAAARGGRPQSSVDTRNRPCNDNNAASRFKLALSSALKTSLNRSINEAMLRTWISQSASEIVTALSLAAPGVCTPGVDEASGVGQSSHGASAPGASAAGA